MSYSYKWLSVLADYFIILLQGQKEVINNIYIKD